jgi:hypothetical protein
MLLVNMLTIPYLQNVLKICKRQHCFSAEPGCQLWVWDSDVKKYLNNAVAPCSLILAEMRNKA